MKNIYKITLVESSGIAIEGLKSIIESKNLFEITNVFGNVIDFENRIGTSDCDAVIINPKIIGKDKKFIQKINSDDAKIAIIAFTYDLFDSETLNNFDAIISINDNSAQVLRILHEAILKKQSRNADKNSNNEISEREREILISVASGLTNKEIAYKHNISIYTVISHRKNIARKTGIKTVSGLTVYAMLNGLIEMK